MKRVLLTGANGFIGRACVTPLLARGYEIHAVSRSGRLDVEGVIAHRADLLDLPALPRLVTEIAPTHLLHSAWNVSDGTYWTARGNLDWVASGAMLLKAFGAAGGHRAVGVGTCAEYRWDEERCLEGHSALEPSTLYGACKLALCNTYAGVRALGVSAAWARIFFPYGIHEKAERLLPSVIRALIDGKPVGCTEGLQVRDFMYVDDVGAALAAILDCQVTGPVNIATGKGLSIRQVIDEVIGRLGHRELVQFGAIPGRPGDPSVLIGDSRRLSEDVRFHPEVDLKEGIARTIAYWRSARPATNVRVAQSQF
jgi:nucleoside-diphosphate-sugar epimerase